MVDKQLEKDGEVGDKITDGADSPDIDGLVITNGNQDGDENMEEDAEPPTHEITQTDHLNKKLLEAFLSRINNESCESSQSTNIHEDQSQWDDAGQN